jgi:ATP-dependent DNA helicase RecQ
MDFWRFLFHLCGLTLLDNTKEEPLGTLPLPIRTALLQVAEQQMGDALAVEWGEDAGYGAPGRFLLRWGWRAKAHHKPIAGTQTGQGLTDSATTAQKQLFHTVFEVFPVRFPFYQAYVINRLREAMADGQAHLALWEAPEDGPMLLLALMDTLALAERVAQFYALDVALPQITLHRLPTPGPDYCAIATAYLHAPPAVQGPQPDGRRDAFSGCVTIAADAGRAGSGARNAGTIINALNTLRQFFGSSFPTGAEPATGDLQALAPLLNCLARRYFPLAELKPEQIYLLQRVLSGQSGIGILPTGFGKSLVFQLFALVTPGTTLVISPLKSLIHDQLVSMRRLGLGCVHAITSNDASHVKQWTQQQMAAHRIRLLYISPERLRIKSFFQELFPPGSVSPVCALFIDEVHCISEWGHDFRPAYLAIPDLVRKLAEVRGRSIPVVGLTATASRDVRADILQVLRLAPADVVQLSTSDRSNLSLSVHPVPPDDQAKTLALVALLRSTLPATLGIPAAELLAYPPADGTLYSGVVFGLYANAHGRTTQGEGVHHIARALRLELGLPEQAVGVHASTPPSVCPECGSAAYLSQTGKPCVCPDCKQAFASPSPVDKESWQAKLEATQDGFYRGDFPLMVATKSYGMGIDKRNIRFIVHHAIAGGMESYYQEAGRAGRDGKPAHVALVCDLPPPECYGQYLLRELPPPCVTDETYSQFYRCPLARSRLCDAGRQARFIAQSYPGVADDARQVVQVYSELRDRGAAGLQKARSDGEDNDDKNAEKKTDLALFRLQQLGLIQGYTKEYQGQHFVRYEVQRTEHWTAETVADELTVYLARTGLNAAAVADAVIPLQSTELWSTGKKDLAARYEFLACAARILLQRVYDRVPRMRYTMLSSLLRYAFNDQHHCRRLYIRTYFDAHPPDDNYRCEFCDVCHPDLQFTRQEAVIPEADRQLAYMMDRLPALLKGFAPHELKNLVGLAEAKVAVASLFEKVNRVLEEDATNVAALFLTGALARRQPRLHGLAFERLRFAFTEGERQGLVPAALQLIWAEGAEIDPAGALAWVDRRGGPFDSPAGLKTVEAAAANAYGAESQGRRTIRSLRRVRGYHTLQADVAGVARSLEELHTRLTAVAAPDVTAANLSAQNSETPG